MLENITLDLPEVPELKDIKKASFNRDKKIIDEIIKPKDELIQKLHAENISLHKELSKQEKLVDIASDYEKNHTQMLVDNTNLKLKCRKLEESLEDKEKEFKNKLEDTIFDISYEYKQKINNLERQNMNFRKMIDKFKSTLHKFIIWICHKFSYPSEDQLIRDFERETYTDFNIENKLDIEQFEKEENDYEIDW